MDKGRGIKDGGTRASLRSIPSVDEILASSAIAELKARHPRFPWTRFIRRVVDGLRDELIRGTGPVAPTKGRLKEKILKNALSLFANLRDGGLRPVLNGTGVILHTNLGRAVLGQKIARAIEAAATGYVNLEFDLDSGERGERGEAMRQLIEIATGAEAAMVVNNNAAAVYLIADTFSPPGRIVVSRGELVEIGGSFRLPDILSRAAGEVIEVGTTNRTFIKDYEEVAGGGDILLKVHRSNYEVKGFTHEALLPELIDLAKRKRCFVVYDLGSGALYDFASAGWSGEEQVEEIIGTGVDCVTMSGDKLLGGVQAGLIVGKSGFIGKLASNPLRRAFRVDKLCIAALEALFKCYLFDRSPQEGVPLLLQVFQAGASLEKRAEKILNTIRSGFGKDYMLKVVGDPAAVGGGTFAGREVPGVAISIECSSEKQAVALARRLRKHRLPLIPRVKGKEVRFNMRSVLPHEDGDLGDHIIEVLRGGSS